MGVDVSVCLATISFVVTHALGRVFQAQILGLMFVDVFLCFGDCRKFSILLLHYDLVTQHRKVLCENAQQRNGRFSLFWRHYPGGKVSLFHLRPANGHTPFSYSLRGALELLAT